jgi:hypothetical protein
VLIFEPAPGNADAVDAVLVRARARAEAAGWHCWAYRNEMAAHEITLFLEGPVAPGGHELPVFGTEIQELRTLAGRFEPVRSLIEHPIEVPAP